MHSLPTKLQASVITTSKTLFNKVNKAYREEVKGHKERRAQKRVDTRNAE